MSKLFYGSICLTDMIEAGKQGHSAFKKAENGKMYVSVNVWINDEPDRFGNNASVQINPTKESGHEKKYVGNLKISEVKTSEPRQADIGDFDNMDDLPF